MRMDDRTDLYGRHRSSNGFERLASSALDYLRSRSSDHWLMFVAGLAIGLFSAEPTARRKEYVMGIFSG